MGRWGFPWVLLIGCGGDKGEPEPRDAAAGTCIDQCEVAAKGTDCDTTAVEGECESLCGFLMLAISDDCLENYQDVLDCQIGQSYTCNGSIEINGVDWPVPDDTEACSDLQDAYEDCLGTFGSTTR